MLGFVIGYMPWFGYWIVSSQGNDPRESMLLGCAVGFGIAVILMLRTAATHQPLSSIEPGSAIAFAILGAMAYWMSPGAVNIASQFTSSLALLLIVLGGIALRRPFTMAYAKAQTDPRYWNRPGFIHVNYVITWAWAAVFAVSAVSGVASVFVTDDTILETVLAWVVPIVAAVVCVRWQLRYIAESKAKGERLHAAYAAAHPEAAATTDAEGAPPA